MTYPTKIGEIKQVPTKDLKPHPKNPNKHTAEQIDRLAKIIAYQGFRYPIKVSLLSGYITSGHGRLLAAKKLGLETVPVSYQSYDSPDQEYADIVSDNSVAAWADLDLSLINQEVGALGPDFDIDLLGLKEFNIDLSDSDDPAKDAAETAAKTFNLCPNCGHSF